MRSGHSAHLVQLDGHLLHLGLQLVSVGLLQRVAGGPSAAVPSRDGRGHLTLGAKQSAEQEQGSASPGTAAAASAFLKRTLDVSYVIPISFRSFSVRVRNIRRSTSCSWSRGRYLEKPICSRNSARSCRNTGVDGVRAGLTAGSCPGVRQDLTPNKREKGSVPLGLCRTMEARRGTWHHTQPRPRGDPPPDDLCTLSGDLYWSCESRFSCTGPNPGRGGGGVTTTPAVGATRGGGCAHLVALHGAFPAERGQVRPTVAAAAAAPHGGQVGVQERAVACSRAVALKWRRRHKVVWRTLPLTSAAAALDVQLVDGRGHVAEADTVALFASVRVRRVSWWRIELCEGK